MKRIAKAVRSNARALMLSVLLSGRLWAGFQESAPVGGEPPAAEADSAECPAPALAPAPGWQGDRFTRWVASRELLYPSQDHRGEPRQYSGRLYLPTPWWRREQRSVPLVVYVHGTEAELDQIPQFNRGVESMVGAMAAYFHNFAVAMPDLPGYGKDPSGHPHPYCHAKSLAFSVLDIIKPALGLLAAGKLKWDGRVFLVGYSAGGYGAMAAVKERHTNPRYADLPLTGAACMAGPFQFSESVRAFLAGASPYHRPDIQLFLLKAYDDLYPDTGLFSPARALNPKLLEPRTDGVDQGELQQWLCGTCSGSLICQKVRFRLTGSPDALTPARMVMNPDWLESQLLSEAWPETEVGRILRENDLVGGWAPRVPMLLATSPTDEIVPPSNTHAIMAAWAEAGCTAPVSLYPLTLFGAGTDHVSGAPLALEKAFFWFGALGRPLRSRL